MEPPGVPPETFGELVRRMRERAGLSQEALGELVGRKRGAIANWEKGTSVPDDLETTRALAEAIDVQAEDLIDLLDGNAPARVAEDQLTDAIIFLGFVASLVRREDVRSAGGDPLAAAAAKIDAELVHRFSERQCEVWGALRELLVVSGVYRPNAGFRSPQMQHFEKDTEGDEAV